MNNDCIKCGRPLTLTNEINLCNNCQNELLVGRIKDIGIEDGELEYTFEVVYKGDWHDKMKKYIEDSGFKEYHDKVFKMQYEEEFPKPENIEKIPLDYVYVGTGIFQTCKPKYKEENLLDEDAIKLLKKYGSDKSNILSDTNKE